MIPAEIDVQQIIDDLHAWGWRNSKIEIACGLSNGYIYKLTMGTRPMRPYQHCARLYNFWHDELEAQKRRELAERRTQVSATT